MREGGARRSRARAERARLRLQGDDGGERGVGGDCELLGELGARKRIGGEGVARGDGSAAEKLQFGNSLLELFSQVKA